MINKNTEGGQHKKNVQAYLKYSGLAFQLAGIVVISLLAGRWLDNRFGFEKPILTITFVLVFFSTFMYKLYRELSQK